MRFMVVHGFRAPLTCAEVHGNRAGRNLLRCTVFCAPRTPEMLHRFRAPKVHPRGCNIGIPSLLGIFHPLMHGRARARETPCRVCVRGYANRGLRRNPPTARAWNEAPA